MGFNTTLGRKTFSTVPDLASLSVAMREESDLEDAQVSDVFSFDGETEPLGRNLESRSAEVLTLFKCTKSFSFSCRLSSKALMPLFKANLFGVWFNLFCWALELASFPYGNWLL